MKYCLSFLSALVGFSLSAANWSLTDGVLSDADTGWAFKTSGASNDLRLLGVAAQNPAVSDLDLSTLDGVQSSYKVTSTGFAAFRTNQVITKVTMPTSFTKMDETGFQINTPIGPFSGCSNLVEVVFPEVKNLCSAAFTHCIKLTKVVSPKVTGINSKTFQECVSLTSFDYSLVTTLGHGTFSNCRSLTGEYNFDKVTTIGQGTFGGSQITGLKLPLLKEIQTSALKNMAKLEYLELPKLAKSVSDTFYGNESLKELILPKFPVISTPDFYNCSAMTNLCVPRLKSITQQYPLNDIFYNCVGLTEFKMPYCMESVGTSRLFTKCSSLTNIGIHASSPLWELMTTNETEKTKIIGMLKAKTNAAGNGVSEILEVVSYGGDEVVDNVKYYYDDLVPNNGMRICAMTNATAAVELPTEVELPTRLAGKRVDSIEVGAFLGMTKLQRVKLPKGVMSVGKYAFNECTPGLVVEVFNGSTALISALDAEYGENIVIRPYASAGLKIIVR